MSCRWQSPVVGIEPGERDLPEPSRGEVRVRVQACGVCHSDILVPLRMASSYPRVPEHEVAGVVDAIGEDVSEWQVGQAVGVGWYGGVDFTCVPCRRGDFIDCRNLRVTGLAFYSGYAEAMLVPATPSPPFPAG